ncbi:MBL fold metallo-hydrolase [Demequina sp. SYSU T00039]|uniref:MBL fold metallo-hydrolase n=1 Tax=Demequina lignilytica TaxID=3051663 RepID=A0AAW7M9B0_9MICO|nr:MULTISPECIES: MBL fold metallo-hydrolase [unclassified Demequina]MDN4479149.1 MBL fold metallo-hydrolase [Demequina sp. SYSU T00039-1]MDN4489138.1 MBL fold metallo-hydrolase [Demequina sp. SYSU T00039]MDN4490241.1 MBL fold metallo-hydrolase [Demequina sp. SYSU T00068]
MTVTAVPAQHGPDAVAEQLGDVTGFVLEAPGWPTLYFSGDNSETAVVARVARRFPDVEIALVCAGAARVARLDDALLTLDAARTLEVAGLWPAATVVPIHVDDWAHFSQPRHDLREAVRDAPGRDRIVLLEKGASTRLPRASAALLHA